MRDWAVFKISWNHETLLILQKYDDTGRKNWLYDSGEDCSVAEPKLELEPEPVELKLFWRTEAGTEAIISYFGSGTAVSEPKLSF